MPFIKPKKPENIIQAPVPEVGGGLFCTFKFMPSIQHDYLPEDIEDIEEMYIDMIACLPRSRILKLCGHIRYLRQKLKDEGIVYHSEKTFMEEKDKYYYTKVSRWE